MDINSAKSKLLSSSASLFSVRDSSKSIAVNSVNLLIFSKLLSSVSVSSVEVSPIEVTDVAPDGEGGLIVTVSFKVTQYRADGGVDSHASFVDNT